MGGGGGQSSHDVDQPLASSANFDSDSDDMISVVLPYNCHPRYLTSQFSLAIPREGEYRYVGFSILTRSSV